MTDKKEGLPEFNNPPKPPRKSPVPSGLDRIKSGALNLSLKDRVQLRNDLTDSINGELELMEKTFTDAKKLIGKE